MAQAETLTLPAQPAAGSNEYIPLGGDGWTAPQSAFMVDMQITGDASGGNSVLTIERDNRFEQIVSFLSIESVHTLALQFALGIRRIPGITIHHVGVAPITTAVSLTSVLWAPPAFIDPTGWEAVFPNIDTIVSRFRCLVYNFNIQASHKIPLNILLSSLPRSPSAL